jgi:2-desacetyl-2-hydroxyethyl bacteriochlorophyllide A dehydrogenase
VRAFVVPEPGTASLETIDDPTPRAGQVVVRVDAAGICGTDLHILDGHLPSAAYPLIPGHEVAGEIVALGEDVDLVEEGQRVAVDPSVYCGGCQQCRAGWTNLCDRWGGMGVTRPGGFAEFVAVPASWCEVLPREVPTERGALVEPIACALHALDRAGALVGKETLIFGAGTMGSLLAALFARGGARSVMVVDPVADRLDLASSYGATHTATALADLPRPGGEGWDVTVDASGVIAAIEDAVRVVRRAGRVVVVGVARADRTARFSPYEIYNREATIVGSMAVLHSFGRAPEILASGVIDPDLLISHRFGLEDIDEAVSTVREGRGRKVLVLPRGAR